MISGSGSPVVVRRHGRHAVPLPRARMMNDVSWSALASGRWSGFSDGPRIARRCARQTTWYFNPWSSSTDFRRRACPHQAQYPTCDLCIPFAGHWWANQVPTKRHQKLGRYLQYPQEEGSASVWSRRRVRSARMRRSTPSTARSRQRFS